MLGFWVLAALISAGAAILILLRAATAARRTEGEAPTVAVYRRQLSEIDDLAERGLLGAEEQRAARAEAGRRLLKEAEQPGAPSETAAWRDGRRAVLAIAILAPVLAMAAYLAVGSPGTPDQPFAHRMKAWRAEDPAKLTLPQMQAVLQSIVAERPKDAQPLVFLARVEMAQGDSASAVRALEKAAALAPRDASVWSSLGEARTLAAEGKVDADARDAFMHAVAIDPANPSAIYFLARAAIADGRVAQGLAGWKALLAALPADDPRRPALQAEIAEVQRDGGLPAQPAPAAETPAQGGAEQAAFIQSMVDRLAARLKAQPEDPQGWARLIRAYGVLGVTAKRDAAIGEARRLFKDRPADLKTALDVAAPAPPP